MLFKTYKNSESLCAQSHKVTVHGGKINFNAKKFEQIIHGNTKNTEVESYKATSGDPITIKATVKDLGVFSTNNLLFKELMGKT